MSMTAKMTHSGWEGIANQARRMMNDSIPEDWRIPLDIVPLESQLDVTRYPEESGLLSKSEIAITRDSATSLVQKLKARELSSEEVTVAFCKRAAIAQQLTNCLSVVMFRDAIERARQLDRHLRESGSPVGPLHGLPISLKDGFNVAGHPSSLGLGSWALDSMKHDSSLVATLKELGAVPFVKTNVPTAMMIAESVNNIYGRTVNPRNRATTSGGSSGGESALIAMGGSCLGVGTDIGGSTRIPAACTGIFGLKPSAGRFPHFDARTCLAGQESIASVPGPMARSIPDLALWCKSILETFPWLKDPKVIPMPWRSVNLPAKFKIAVLHDNGIVRPTPPITRALNIAAQKLASAGHNVIEWPADDCDEAHQLMYSFFTADGGTSIRTLLDSCGEPWRPELQPYAEANMRNVHELWQLQSARTALQKRYLDRLVETDVDAILSPTTPYVTPKHGGLKSVHYTGIFNILDYASLSFPTGLTADKDVDTWLCDGYMPRNEIDAATYREYDPEMVHMLPISLQLTAGRLQEEKLLAMAARIIEDLA